MTTPDSLSPQTRTQRRAADMRRTLVETAESLLIEGGAAAVTAEEVARRADVSLQTVYNRVGGKPALLLAIAERALEENRSYMDAAYASDGTPEERAKQVCMAYIRFALERPHQFRILANPPEEPEALQRVVGILREQNGKLEELIRDGVREGSVNPALAPDAAATVLWALMNGLLSLLLRNDAMRPETVSSAALIQTALDMLEFGVKKRSTD